ncbi:Pycsar system effector family protein [Flavobacterium sp. UBA4197]|uniref:Pycsar system effector family protein n=1 Tax=Flavobacterium sp. UBA4197 TaxID=1946546 RepID=UPI002579FC12|nr:Pycsar system effector family protein [Flavobacterium sp. UBA4197]
MNITEQAENFVFALLKDKLSISYTYHNFNHTLRVVAAAKQLIDNEKVDAGTAEQIIIAAWFHDTGYVKGCNEHEECGTGIAGKFLKEHGKDDAYIEAVKAIIRVTKIDNEPENLVQKIIKDADYYHFAADNYLELSDLLREEWKLTENRVFTDLEWAMGNRKMMVQSHRYYTDYAKEHWQPKKESNIIACQRIIQKLTEEKADSKSSIKKKKLEKLERPERGIDTMFRVTLNNHTRLSDIADSKANILLSVNAIIISVALSTLVPKLDSPSNAHLIIPTFTMIVFSVLSIIFAILSTRPKVTSGTFTRKDIEDKKVNLLFFGNFYKMPIDEYIWAMNVMMKDRDYLYNSMIKDLYYLGLVLDRKYKLLRITYTIFMIGIIFSVIVFVLAFRSLGV